MMNKNIKNYIEQADYNELIDIMEAAQNRLITIVATEKNPWGSIFMAAKLAIDYRDRLHIAAVPRAEYHCNCAE